jgi:hypothetical protein
MEARQRPRERDRRPRLQDRDGLSARDHHGVLRPRLPSVFPPPCGRPSARRGVPAGFPQHTPRHNPLQGLPFLGRLPYCHQSENRKLTSDLPPSWTVAECRNHPLQRDDPHQCGPQCSAAGNDQHNTRPGRSKPSQLFSPCPQRGARGSVWARTSEGRMLGAHFRRTRTLAHIVRRCSCAYGAHTPIGVCAMCATLCAWACAGGMCVTF